MAHHGNVDTKTLLRSGGYRFAVTRWRRGAHSNPRYRWLSGEGAIDATFLSPRGKPIEVSEGRRYRRRTGCLPGNATCVVRASKAGANHVAIRDRVEDKSHGRVGDVRGGSRIRSHQDARETRSRAAGAELRGP